MKDYVGSVSSSFVFKKRGRVGLKRKIRVPKFGKGARKFLKGLLVLGLVGLVILLALAIVFGGAKQWNGINRLNVLGFDRSSKEVVLASFSPESEGVVMTRLGSEVKIPVVHGYGEYKVGVVGELGRQEGYGYDLLEKSVEQWLGLDLAGTVTVGVDWSSPGSSWRSFRTGSLRIAGGSLSFLDRVLFLWNTRWLDGGDVTLVDLGEFQTQSTLLDGSMEYRIEKGRLDAVVGSMMSDKIVTDKSEIRVAVVNGTKTSGLAKSASRILENVGYDVVGVFDALNTQESTIILSDGNVEVGSDYFAPMKNLFDATLREMQEDEQDFRANVALVLGEDYLKMLEEK